MASRTHLKDVIRPLISQARQEGIALDRTNVQVASNIVDVTFSTDTNANFLTVRFNTLELDKQEEIIQERILKLTRFFEANAYDLEPSEIGYLQYLSSFSMKTKFYYDDCPNTAYDLEAIDLLEFDWLDNGEGFLVTITNKGEKILQALEPHILSSNNDG